MKTILSLFFVAVFGISVLSHPVTNEYQESLWYSHYLNFHQWGSYKRNYSGVSHIPDVKRYPF